MIEEVGSPRSSVRSRRLESPATPADAWIGITHEDVAEGNDVVTWLRPTSHCEQAPGLASPGSLYVLSDAALGWLGLHAVSVDQFIVTSNLHLDILGRVQMGDALRVDKMRVLTVGTYGVLCAGEIVAADTGRPVAHTSGRFAIVPKASRNAGAVSWQDMPEVPIGCAPDGGDIAAQPAGGDAVSRMFGLTIESCDSDAIVFAATAKSHLANDRGGMHGGVAAMLGEHAAARALGLLRPDEPYHSVEGRAVYVRPVPARGGVVRCRVRVLHHGRRQAFVTSSVLDNRGGVAVEVGAVFARS